MLLLNISFSFQIVGLLVIDLLSNTVVFPIFDILGLKQFSVVFSNYVATEEVINASRWTTCDSLNNNHLNQELV